MISIEYFTQVHRNNFPTYIAKQKNISQDRNLPSNAFDDFSQTAYADDNTPNATGDCVKKKLIGSRNKNIVRYVQFLIFRTWKVPWS